MAVSRDDAFHSFFEMHHAELARLAYLVTGEAEVADDLAADALLEVWRHWDRVAAADSPIAYARGVLANLARNRIRRLSRERRGLLGLGLLWRDRTQDVDVPAVVDLRQALHRLPYRRRACVVLRYAFDLSERETARALGISVGTVKSQTSRGVAQLTALLGGQSASTSDGARWLAPASRAIVPPGPSGRGS
ncbi:SigE family RNA polymerase sigma factor [Phytohabitans houttuyneae]|uniref:RNA polymerase sigma factor n=1 Tax=Phytohabitans houttuyneae TaxID=1076126 RepID=A0A6V8KSQ4_9ACTN|nr:SigE family RNA polymerase sigma factor [Phytohabitans houttuyneae]GFJ83635.1 RNA polymerase sigma factor [Phytohabitans houttuyneae]